MTSCGDVIALEGAGEKRGSEQFRLRSNMKPRKALKHYPYFVDPAIVPRVKQYLEDNKDKVYVDIDEMVTELQRKYRDYAKKKRVAFKGMVEKAFAVVLKTYHVNNEDLVHRDEESDSSSVSGMDIDSEDVDLIVEPSNLSNNQVMNMYMQQQNLKRHVDGKSGSASGGTKELIDISSDEEEQTPAKRSKHTDTNNVDPTELTPTVIQPCTTQNGQATPEEVKVAKEPVTPSLPLPPATLTPAPVQERPKRKKGTVDGGSGPPVTSFNSDVSRRKKREVAVVRPCYSFKDVGGSSAVLQEVCKLLVHLRHPELFEQIGVSPPRGFLLHGPPGCGKSLLANAIAGELGVPLLKVAAPELVAGVSGESEERIRDLFDQAVSLAPCVLFLDEIDAITPNRNNAQREMERRIVAQLLTTLDELGEKEGGNQVLVVGATNRPDALDPALRRAGRFDREVCMGIPDKEARAHILRVVCGRLALAPDVSSDAGIDELASLTPGFVGADLTALTREAAMVAINRIFAQLQEKLKGDSSDNREEERVKISTPSGNGQENITKTQETNEKEVSEEKIQEEVLDKPANEAVNVDAVVPSPDNGSSATESQEMKLSMEVIQPSSETVNVSEVCQESKSSEDNEIQIDENPQADKEIRLDEEKGELKEICASTKEPAAKNEAEDNDEICVVNQETQDSRKEGTSAAAINPPSSEEIEIIPQSDETEKESAGARKTCEKEKTDIDVEVVEVDMVNGGEESTERNVISEVCAVDNSASEKVEPKDLALTQKLLPSSIWSPELCHLMSWLRETPPLNAAQLSALTITMSDFHEALRHVQPSAKREGFATVPDVTWEDVGSLKNVRAELQLCVLAPVRYAKQFSQLGLNAPAGVLLCGPPGCGKTLLAKAVANEAGINFISVKGPELLNMYVGESERAVRQVFQRARNSAPCVIFFDELDALCPKRSDSGDNAVSSRVVNQLLTEMDGVEGRAAVFLMAASNRPDIIDPAVLRPGRLDKLVYVGLPNAEDRKDILRALTKNGSRPQIASDVDLDAIASRPQFEGFSGADLAALVREAGIQALRDFMGSGGDLQQGPLSVALRHFDAAGAKIRPSVTSKARKHYEKLQEMYGTTTSEAHSTQAAQATPAVASDEKPEAMDTA